jgi:hypothetical protein
MEELTVRVKTAKDAALVKTFLEKKFKGIKIQRRPNEKPAESHALPGKPMTWDELEKSLDESEQQIRDGKYITLEELQNKFQKKWQVRKKSMR